MSDHEPSTFEYDDLGDASLNTTLLRLLPGEPDDIISCELYKVAFSIYEEYHTLSYEWGPPGEISTILVNDHPFVIRRNLHSFLWRVRSNASYVSPMESFVREIRVWVDAICIDQDNIAQKNGQIPKMYEIYRHARTTLVWFGEGDAASLEAMKCLVHWLKSPENVHRLLRGKWDEDLKDRVNWKTSRALSQLQAPETAEMWQAFCEIYRLPYWSRTWVVQEVLLSDRISLFLGPWDLPFWGMDVLSFFQEMYRAVRSTFLFFTADFNDRNWPRGFESQVRSILSMEQLAQWTHNFHANFKTTPASTIVEASHKNIEFEILGESLTTSIRSHSKSKCHDPHDKIYAFLGLAQVDDSQWKAYEDKRPYREFVVDYNTPLLDLALYTLDFCRSTEPIEFAYDLLHTLDIWQINDIEESSRTDWMAAYRTALLESISRIEWVGHNVGILSSLFVGLVISPETWESTGLSMFMISTSHFPDTSDPECEPGDRTKFTSQGTRCLRVAGGTVHCGDVAFSLLDGKIMAIYRAAAGHLRYIGIAFCFLVNHWYWPGCLRYLEGIQPPQEISAFTRTVDKIRADIPLNLEQIFILASVVMESPDDSEQSKKIPSYEIGWGCGAAILTRLGVVDPDLNATDMMQPSFRSYTICADYVLTVHGYQQKKKFLQQSRSDDEEDYLDENADYLDEGEDGGNEESYIYDTSLASLADRVSFHDPSDEEVDIERRGDKAPASLERLSLDVNAEPESENPLVQAEPTRNLRRATVYVHICDVCDVSEKPRHWHCDMHEGGYDVCVSCYNNGHTHCPDKEHAPLIFIDQCKHQN